MGVFRLFSLKEEEEDEELKNLAEISSKEERYRRLCTDMAKLTVHLGHEPATPLAKGPPMNPKSWT